MELLELSHYPGLLDRVHSFLGRGHEYCLALASKEALTTVAQITDRENAQSVADTGTMKVAELKNALRQRSLRVSGRKALLGEVEMPVSLEQGSLRLDQQFLY